MWSNWSALQGLNAFLWTGGIAGPAVNWLPTLETILSNRRYGPGMLGNSAAQAGGVFTVLTEGLAPYAGSPAPVCGDHTFGAPARNADGSNYRVGVAWNDKNGIRDGYYHFSLYARTESAGVSCEPEVRCGNVAPSSYADSILPANFGQWYKLFDHQIVLQPADYQFYVNLNTEYLTAEDYTWWDKIVLRALDQCAPTAIEAGIMDSASVCIEGDMWGAQR